MGSERGRGAQRGECSVPCGECWGGGGRGLAEEGLENEALGGWGSERRLAGTQWQGKGRGEKWRGMGYRVGGYSLHELPAGAEGGERRPGLVSGSVTHT